MLAETSSTTPYNWKSLLEAEKKKNYFQDILKFIESERALGKIIYPKNQDIFSAFALTQLEDLKVVILGQDPYHGPGQAHGLAFSVQKGIPQPPSLQNIFKELNSDCGIPPPTHGSLQGWARQGVFLLNSSLTVEKGTPGSHSSIGWETFTHAVIQRISEVCPFLVFMLWGSHAQKKSDLIDAKKHFILSAPHPSPFSVHKGFFGCKHFSRANEQLVAHGISPIDWSAL